MKNWIELIEGYLSGDIFIITFIPQSASVSITDKLDELRRSFYSEEVSLKFREFQDLHAENISELINETMEGFLSLPMNDHTKYLIQYKMMEALYEYQYIGKLITFLQHNKYYLEKAGIVFELHIEEVKALLYPIAEEEEEMEVYD